jgi:glutamate formiminotransferase/formiminotetrahydrofolate cyclodeaminase
MLIEKKINNFLEELASSSPTPGGGSVAALVGALGAALLSMVGNLTIGKNKYIDVEEDFKKIVSKTEKLRMNLSQLVDEDIKVFNEFMAIFKMPRNTDSEKKLRSEKMQEALLQAAQVPLETGFKCLDVIFLSEEVAQKGNVNVISDAGVAVLLAEAALESAILNVKINLKMIKDENAKEKLKSSLIEIKSKKEGLKEKIINIVEKRM